MVYLCIYFLGEDSRLDHLGDGIFLEGKVYSVVLMLHACVFFNSDYMIFSSLLIFKLLVCIIEVSILLICDVEVSK